MSRKTSRPSASGAEAPATGVAALVTDGGSSGQRVASMPVVLAFIGVRDAKEGYFVQRRREQLKSNRQTLRREAARHRKCGLTEDVGRERVMHEGRERRLRRVAFESDAKL